MRKRKSLPKGILRAGISLALCMVTVLTLVVPGLDLKPTEPENPLGQHPVQEIEDLNLGENISQMNTIVVPSGGSAPPTEPKDPVEATDPEQTEPNETIPQETESEQPDINDGEEGNEDGNQGEEGGEMLELDLAAVMTWYKYGNDPSTITCSPDRAVAKDLNTAQLKNDELRYEFSLKGSDARYVTIQSVTVTEGDGAERSVREEGEVTIQLPGGVGKRNYTFRVKALAEKRGDAGETVSQEVEFAFVLRCHFAIDLEMNLHWRNKDGRIRTIICAPDRAEAISVRNYELNERVFVFTTELTGSLADNAEITEASYTTADGSRSGTLEKNGGSLILNTAPGKDTDTYYLTFTVKTQDRTVRYTYQLEYQQTPDVALSFTWEGKGMVSHNMTCMPGSSVTSQIKNNQLSAGSIFYRMELTGRDAQGANIMSVSYSSDTGSGRLEPRGTLPISMGADATINTYRITVDTLVQGQRMQYEILLHYANDVMLEMTYSVNEDGRYADRIVACENGKTRSAENIYDDQLEGGLLVYDMDIVGGDAEGVTITSVSCYQSGTGRTIGLDPSGRVELKLKEGKTGENTFTVKAKDSEDAEYTFDIIIPYKHRGENSIVIETNLTDGQRLPNEVKTNLTVKARSEDSAGNLIDYIPATGTDTKLIVKFDGEELRYVSSSGVSSEYDIVPKNPEEGDTNQHTLEIYAEDAFGNYGQLQMTFIGERREAGHQIGTATIYVDLTVLGLGVLEPIPYDVLAFEPVSYVIAKAIMGQTLEEPFGQARRALGWAGRYEGTLDRGFYLQSLTTGLHPDALEGGKWPGTTEKEVLAAIDARFGRGSGLATLWRCLYRNGLDKGPGSGGTIGEFDYTSGSGWMYSVGGTTYYPGQSMSATYLQDGDVLTIRFTLAQGWDVGGGNPGYSSTVGYCVTAMNGNFYFHHQVEAVTDENGRVIYVCRCCGLEENCAHANTRFVDRGDGTHEECCDNCGKSLGNWAEHSWGAPTVGDNHVCTVCGGQEPHFWIETDNTAGCEEAGTLYSSCNICGEQKEEVEPPRGHDYSRQWFSTDDNQQHYQECGRCGAQHNFAEHSYLYDPGWGDFQCEVCGMVHGFWGLDCPGELVIQPGSGCDVRYYTCSHCGCRLVEYGTFHEYEDGFCLVCGEPDPDYVCPHGQWSDWIVEIYPDCVNDGLKYRECTDCGDIMDRQTIPATGHEFTEGFCAVCNAPDTP